MPFSRLPTRARAAPSKSPWTNARPALAQGAVGSGDRQVNWSDDARPRLADERDGVDRGDGGAGHQHGHHVLSGLAEPDRRVDAGFAFDHNAETLGVGPLRFERVVAHGPADGELDHRATVAKTAIGAALATGRAGGVVRPP